MPTLTPEQRKKWVRKTKGGVPCGKKLCRGCVEDKPLNEFRGINVYYCIRCEEWYQSYFINCNEYAREYFINDAF